MIEFFLKRRILGNLVTLLIVAVGAWHSSHTRREAFPEVAFDIVAVRTFYPAATPQDVERLVTTPVEETLKDVNNIDRVESYSIEGLSVIVVCLMEHLSRAEVARVVSDIQQAVSNVEELPEEAKTPIVNEMTSDRPLITLSVAGGEEEARDAPSQSSGTMGVPEGRHEFAEKLKDLIEEIPGVARVDEEGGKAKEIWVEVDPKKLAQYQITL